MKKLFYLLLLIPALANATVTGSCKVNGSTSNIAGISPFPVFFDYTGTTDTNYTKGTATGCTVNSTAYASGNTTLALTGCNAGGTMLAGDYVKVAGTGITVGTTVSNKIVTYGTWPTLSTVTITGTAGQFAASATVLYIGMPLKISGTFGGTGSITGYSDPTTYYVIATNGTTTFQLSATLGGAAITTTAGTPTGLTYTYTYYAKGMHVSGTEIGAGEFIASIQPGTSFTLGQNALATNAAATMVVDDPNLYLVSSTTGNPITSLTIASPGLLDPTVGAETVTMQNNYRLFHALDYTTNFGDPNGSPVLGATWNTDIAGTTVGTGLNTSRNMAKGPLAAHIYEITSGGGDKVFNPVVVIRDANGVAGVSVNCPTVTVYDPEGATNGYGAANKTACIANGVIPVAGDTDGCPAVATCGTSNICVNSSNYQTSINAAVTAGARRILLRRGDTFTSTAQTSLTPSGIQIGAYGSLAKSLPVLNLTATSVAVFRPQPALSGLLVRDLAMTATGSGNLVVNNAGNGTTNVSLLRITASGFRDGIDGAPFPTNGTPFDYIAMQDSDLTNFDSTGGAGAYGTYCGGCNHFVSLGNYGSPCAQVNAEGIRLQGGNYAVVGHNSYIGSQSPACGTVTIRGVTQYGVESDNYLPGFGPTFRPQSNGWNEDQRDWIAERNYITYPYRIEGHFITLRNIAGLVPSSSSSAIIAEILNISTGGSPMPDQIFVYNDSAYSTDSGTGKVGVWLRPDSPGLGSSCNVFVENTLLYMPNATSPALLGVNGSCTVTGASGTLGNSSDAQIKNTNPFTVTPSTLLDFRKTIAAVCDGTTNSPQDLWSSSRRDFLNCGPKIGANICAGAMVPAASAMCFGAAQ